MEGGGLGGVFKEEPWAWSRRGCQRGDAGQWRDRSLGPLCGWPVRVTKQLLSRGEGIVEGKL